MIERYGVKCINELNKKPKEEGLENINKGHTDPVMFLIWLGCKLASQKLENASSKVAYICKLLSEGEVIQRDHLQFLIQFVKHKNTKL